MWLDVDLSTDRLLTSGNFFDSAILNEEWANPLIDYADLVRILSKIAKKYISRTSSVLYMAMATPLPLKS